MLASWFSSLKHSQLNTPLLKRNGEINKIYFLSEEGSFVCMVQKSRRFINAIKSNERTFFLGRNFV